MNSIEIYFRDLTPEKQQEILEEWDTTEDNENWDVYPLCIIEREDEDPEDE